MARSSSDSGSPSGKNTSGKGSKAGKAAKPEKKPGRLSQIRQTYKIAKRNDPNLGWILLALFVGVLAIFIIGALLLPIGVVTKVLVVLLGVSVALLVVSFIFGRRAEKSAYAQIAGQPGAAAAVLEAVRGDWTTLPAVAVTKNEDLVHLTIGRPGVVIVGEGAPSRVRNLMTNQRKKVERWVPDTPIYEIQVGEAEGQVPLTKVQKTLMKYPRALRPAEVTEVRRRLEAATKASSALPIPKGPIPKSARGQRPPKGMR